MITRIRKLLSPTVKEKILHSLPYRVLSRVRLKRQAIRFSCELTTRCNAKCDICTRYSQLQNGQLDVGDMNAVVIKHIVQEIKKFHDYGKRVCFEPMGLGEPLLYKDLFELFGEIKHISQKISIVLVTNGILLDDVCCKKLVALGIDEVSVSLNVNNASDYSQRMGIDAYDKVYRNIENLIRLRNKSGKRLPSVFVQYIDYNNDKRTFQKVIKQWLKIMRYNDKCYVHPIVNQAGFFNQAEMLESQDTLHPCTQPLWRIAVKLNGDLYPCCSCFYSGLKQIDSLYLGNIRTESPFGLFTWNSSKRLKIIEAMRQDDYTQLTECKICNVPNKLECNCYFKLPQPLRIKGHRWL